MRILLFLATNIAVLVLVSLIFNLLGLEGILANNGVDLNLSSLLIFCALFGFSVDLSFRCYCPSGWPKEAPACRSSHRLQYSR